MATGIATNRTNINLPAEISEEIISKTQESSAVMQLARQINLPGRGIEIPVIVSDPEAEWVAETGKKPVSNPELDKKVMQAFKLAVIVPFSNEFRRDASALYDELVRRLPGALAKKFDETVFGKYAAPGSNFDTFANLDAWGELSEDVYGGLVDADAQISANGGVMNGIVLSPQGKSLLLKATDKDGRPLFINNVSEGAVPMVLGAKTMLSKAAYYETKTEDTTSTTFGIAGDWSQALYGTVEGVTIGYSEDATLDLGEGQTINLFQHNMFAIRAEIEVGFRANTNAFAKLGYSGA